MDAKDLRIGNWVYVKGSKKTTSVTDLITDCSTMANGFLCFGYQGDQVIPIPLTEEILLKCGFIHGRVYFTGDTGWKKSGETFSIQLVDKGEYFSFHSAQFNLRVIHLHQLQNLYYALTGEELTIEI